MDISIIIVNYNTKTLIKQCLQSVFEKTKEIEFEVIVIDNASHDGSQKMLKEEFPHVILIESDENLGFGRANNLGITVAKGRNVFFLNPDTILINSAIKILSDYLDNNNVAVCGGNLYDENMHPTLSFCAMPSLCTEILVLLGLFNRINKNIYFNFTSKPMKVGYITGADMMIKKIVLDTVGRFDPDFFMYYEETELTYRIKKQKYQIISVPDAKIIHLEGKSFSTNTQREKRILEARRLFYKKTHSDFYLFVVNNIYFLTAFSRMIIFSILGNKEKSSFWKFILKNIYS